MALSFQGLKNKLVAQVESNESLRRVLTPEQYSSRVRKTSDNSSVTSETHSVSSNMDHNTSVNLQALGSNSVDRSENFMNSSQLSLNSTIDIDNASYVNTRSPNVQHSGDESSVCDGSSNQHIPSISVRPSSRNGNVTPKKRQNENAEAVSYIPTSEEIDVIVSNYSQDQVVTAFLKNKARLQNLKTAIKTVRSQNEELQRDQYKLTQLLESSQDKYMRKISELKEAASLDKEAKAHMEGILRAELEEKSLIIESLNQKIAILKSSSLENDSETPEGDETQSNQVSNLLTSNQYESLYNNLQSSLDVLTDTLLQKTSIDSNTYLETTSHVARSCLQLVSKLVEELQGVKSRQFNSDQIQNSIDDEAKMLSYKQVLKNSLKDVDSEIAQTIEQVQCLTNENEELKAEHTSTLETLVCLQADFKQKQSECASLREQGKQKSCFETESLKNENEELLSKLFLAERQAEKLKKDSSNLQQILGEGNQERSQILEKMENLGTKLNDAQAALEAKSTESEKLQIMMSELEQASQYSRSEFAKVNDSSQYRIRILEEEGKKLTSLLQVSEQSHQENLKELMCKSEKLEVLEKQLSEYATELAAKEEYLKQLSEAVKTKQVELEHCYRKLDQQKLAPERLSHAEAEIETLQSEKASLEEQLNSDAVSKLEDQRIVSEEVIESETSQTELSSGNTVFGKTLDRAASSEASTQTADDLECNRISCSNDKLMLQAELTENKARIEELLGKIDCQNRKKYEQDRNIEKIKTLEAQKSTLEESIASVNKEKESSVSALNEKVKELSQLLECKCNELETVVNVSNEEYDNCALENVEIKRNYHQLSQEFESMKEKLKSEKQQAVNDLEISMRDSFNKEIRVLNNEKLESNKLLDAEKKEVEDLREKYDNVVTSFSQMTEKVESLESDVSRLTKQVKNLREALEESETQLMEKVDQEVHSKTMEDKTNLELELKSLGDLHEKQTVDFATERESFNKKIVELEKAFTQADSNAVKMNELLDQYEKSYNEKLSKMAGEMQQQEQEVRFLKCSLEDSESKFEEMQAEFDAKMKKLTDQKASLESEVVQYKDELQLKRKEIEEKAKSVKEMKEKMESMKVSSDQQKIKFDDYRRKVEEKFSSQKQIINEKFKAKEKEVVEMKEVITNLELKLKTSEEEKESMATANGLKSEEIEKLSQELAEGQKLLNSTLEQSQQDLESLKSKLEEEVLELKNQNERLQVELTYKNEGHVQDLEDEIRDMKAQIEAKECSINALKEEVSNKDKLIAEKSLAHDEEKQSLTKIHFAERNKLSSDIKLLQNNVSELEMTLANVKRDYQKYQMKMEDITKKNKEQMENVKNLNTKERLAKDRELKVQADEIVKLKETVQKMKNKHGEEVAEVKSKHANLVKNLDDQIRETKSTLQITIDALKRNHEEELNKLNAKHREEVTQFELNREQELKNLLLEHEQKSAAAEAELGKVLSDQIEDWKNKFDKKSEECEGLTSQVSQLTSKLQKEALTATLNEYKQKYDNLIITSQNDLKRLEKQTDQKMKSMESRFNEEQRVLEKQVQEQKLIIANLEFEITDLESNYQAERSRNEVLSKEAKIAQKNSDLKSLIEAKESEIQRMEESAKMVLKSKETEFEERLKSERDRIVREMDEFYSQKYEDMLSSEDQNANDQSLQSLPNGSVKPSDSCRNPAQLVLSHEDSPNLASAESFKGSRESLFCFEDPTQMQFLRHILRQFILGSEKVVMARVLVTLAKFDQKDSKTILDAVKQSQKWVAFP